MQDTKKVTVMGKEYIIKKLDARTGSFLLFFVLEKFLPNAMDMQSSEDMQKVSNQITGHIMKQDMMSKDEFIRLQNDCLSVVHAVLPSGDVPILNDNGSWRIPEMATNTFLVLILTAHALLFNVSDFFTEDGWKELRSLMEGISLANFKM